MPQRISGRTGNVGNKQHGKFATGTVPNPPGKLQTRQVKEHHAGDLINNWVQHISQLSFPANRDQLVEQARAHGIDDEVIQALQHMPESHYASLDELRRGLSGRL